MNRFRRLTPTFDFAEYSSVGQSFELHVVMYTACCPLLLIVNTKAQVYPKRRREERSKNQSLTSSSAQTSCELELFIIYLFDYDVNSIRTFLNIWKYVRNNDVWNDMIKNPSHALIIIRPHKHNLLLMTSRTMNMTKVNLFASQTFAFSTGWWQHNWYSLRNLSLQSSKRVNPILLTIISIFINIILILTILIHIIILIFMPREPQNWSSSYPPVNSNNLSDRIFFWCYQSASCCLNKR